MLAQDEMAIRDLTSLSSNLTQTLQQLCYVGLVAAGAFAIGSGDLTVGGLIACTIISGRALSPIAQVVSLFVQWQQASAELQAVRRALGDVPLVGYFAGGEIAHHRLYGYTGVLTVFTTPVA